MVEPNPNCALVRNGAQTFYIHMTDSPIGGVLDVTYVDFRPPPFGYVNRVFVPPGLRGKGMGSHLFDQLALMADTNGITLYIDPTGNYGSDVPRLTRFFERFGFVVVKDAKRGYMCRLPKPGG